MLKTGLVTVTFRKFDVPKICRTAKNAGLELLEWGGDIHVPPMNEEAIRQAKSCSGELGLVIDTYGSYYRCNGSDEEIEDVVKTAAELGAKNLRVWAGTKGNADTNEETRQDITKNLIRVCGKAAQYNLTVSPEFHGGTLTDHWEYAVRLAKDVNAENLRLYWQPNQYRDLPYNLDCLQRLLPHIKNIHVFHWAGKEKFPLQEGERVWRPYIDILAGSGRDHGMLMEFVCDDTEEQLYRDAEVLHRWLA